MITEMVQDALTRCCVAQSTALCARSRTYQYTEGRRPATRRRCGSVFKTGRAKTLTAVSKTVEVFVHPNARLSKSCCSEACRTRHERVQQAIRFCGPFVALVPLELLSVRQQEGGSDSNSRKRLLSCLRSPPLLVSLRCCAARMITCVLRVSVRRAFAEQCACVARATTWQSGYCPDNARFMHDHLPVVELPLRISSARFAAVCCLSVCALAPSVPSCLTSHALRKGRSPAPSAATLPGVVAIRNCTVAPLESMVMSVSKDMRVCMCVHAGATRLEQCRRAVQPAAGTHIRRYLRTAGWRRLHACSQRELLWRRPGSRRACRRVGMIVVMVMVLLLLVRGCGWLRVRPARAQLAVHRQRGWKRCAGQTLPAVRCRSMMPGFALQTLRLS